MTTPAEGSGTEKTYLYATTATASTQAEVQMKADPADAGGTRIAEHWVAFDTETYVVHEGIPNGRPTSEARMKSRVGIGTYVYSDVPPAPADVDTGAVCRWLPTASTVTATGWRASPGYLALTSDTQTAPYLDSDYSFEVRGGDEVELSAVVIDGDSWYELTPNTWSASSFTIAVTAVLHANPEGAMYGVISSYTAPAPQTDPALGGSTDPDAEATTLVDWEIRYRQGVVELFAGGVLVRHVVERPHGRAVVIAISMSPDGGQLLICDRTVTTAAISTDGLNLYGGQMFIGRTGAGYSTDESAWMDVLEVDFFDRALSFAELAELAHDLDSIYGVAG